MSGAVPRLAPEASGPTGPSVGGGDRKGVAPSLLLRLIVVAPRLATLNLHRPGIRLAQPMRKPMLGTPCPCCRARRRAGQAGGAAVRDGVIFGGGEGAAALWICYRMSGHNSHNPRG